MNRSRLLALGGVVLGLAIIYVASLDTAPYGCMESPCHASPPPEDIVSGYVSYGGMAIIIVSLAALALASRRPRATGRVCYAVLAIGLVVLAGSRLYYVDPVVLIPNITLTGGVASPPGATPTRVTFAVCTVSLAAGPSPLAPLPRCDPKPGAPSYSAAVQNGSYSVGLPNGLSYNATVTYSPGFLCLTQFITVKSYSWGMPLGGDLGCNTPD